MICKAFIFAHDQLVFDLLHKVQGNADHNQEASTTQYLGQDNVSAGIEKCREFGEEVSDKAR